VRGGSTLKTKEGKDIYQEKDELNEKRNEAGGEKGRERRIKQTDEMHYGERELKSHYLRGIIDETASKGHGKYLPGSAELKRKFRISLKIDVKNIL